MSLRATLLEWLGGVPREAHAEAVQEAGTRGCLEGERAERERLEAALAVERLAYREARERAALDIPSAVRALYEAGLLEARRLAAERADRWQCLYATQLVYWQAHELISAHTFRLLCNTMGCVGNGFGRALTVAETNLRSVPPPPLAIRGVSIKVALVEGTCKAEHAPDVLAAMHALVRRHVTLALEASQQTLASLPPLDAFDLDGGIVPWSPPASAEEEMSKRGAWWSLVAQTGEFRVPTGVSLTIRVGLHGEELPLPPAHHPLFGSLDELAAEEEERLRRVVREAVSAALDARTHERPL